MRNILILIVLSSILICCNGSSFLEASRTLREKQNDKTGTLKRYTFHQVRKKLFSQKEANFLKSEIDTLFMLEKHSIESGVYYGKIWTKYDSVSYSYSSKGFLFIREKLFSAYTSYLVSKWDTVGIREQEKEYSDIIPQNNVYASMIVKIGSLYDIKTIIFKEFFKVERDR